MYHLSLCDLPTPRDYSTILYWWLKILSPSSLYPLGNWASLSAYFIGTLNSAVQNWTHFLRTPGIYRIKPKFLGLASKTLPLSSAHSLTTAWAFFSMFSNILTSYRSWTHVFLYIVPWAEFMLLDSGTNLPLPIITLVRLICDQWSLMFLLQKHYNSLKAQLMLSIFLNNKVTLN